MLLTAAWGGGDEHSKSHVTLGGVCHVPCAVVWQSGASAPAYSYAPAAHTCGRRQLRAFVGACSSRCSGVLKDPARKQVLTSIEQRVILLPQDKSCAAVVVQGPCVPQCPSRRVGVLRGGAPVSGPCCTRVRPVPVVTSSQCA